MIYTVGHSTRSLEEFMALLRAHRIDELADIRSIPQSRRHPHFSRDPLSRSLAAEGISYRHFPALGGMRRPRRDSRNRGWRHQGFRGYADYMEAPEFERGLDEFVGWATGTPAIMCAEAVWWRCHRQLTADALVARGFEVRHITSPHAATTHTLTDFARLAGRRVSYPGLL